LDVESDFTTVTNAGWKPPAADPRVVHMDEPFDAVSKV
jgi:hypothetical protein